ncbi:hypothetical protein GEMRC1_001363 [Eukaryota sp. GEM-RC1]
MSKIMKPPTTFKVFRLSMMFLTVLTTSALLWGHLYSSQRWDTGFVQTWCLPDNCFCEYDNKESFCRQRCNAWSSLAFAYAGVALLYYAPSLVVKPEKWLLFNLGTLSVISYVLGVGSFLFHATLTLFGERADALGMHYIGLFLCVYSLCRLAKTMGYKPPVSKLFLQVFYPLFAIITYGNFIKDDWETLTWVVMGSEIVVVFVSEIINSRIRKRTPSHLFIKGLSALLFALGIWILDKEHILCWPRSLFQGHSVWHISLAVAVFYMTKLYMVDTSTKVVKVQ